MPKKTDIDAEPVVEETPPAAETQAEAPADLPGKEPEPAAPSGAEPEATPGLAPLGQGAQVVLTGDAQAAARGGSHGDIAANTAARDAAIAAGHIEPATAEAASDATAGVALDDIDETEAAAVEKAHADAREARIARAAKPAS